MKITLSAAARFVFINHISELLLAVAVITLIVHSRVDPEERWINAYAPNIVVTLVGIVVAVQLVRWTVDNKLRTQWRNAAIIRMRLAVKQIGAYLLHADPDRMEEYGITRISELDAVRARNRSQYERDHNMVCSFRESPQFALDAMDSVNTIIETFRLALSPEEVVLWDQTRTSLNRTIESHNNLITAVDVTTGINSEAISDVFLSYSVRYVSLEQQYIKLIHTNKDIQEM